jgi:putative hydrolase of the HAD superfamily
MTIDCIFFDLDGTLYPETNGLWLAIKLRIVQYMTDRIGLDPETASLIREDYLQRYGTTLRGLQIEKKINAREYLNYVHDLPLENYLAPDPALKFMIQRLDTPHWIFTNSDINHTKRVIKMLDLDGCFDGIIDITRLDYICKPDLRAYQQALEAANIQNVSNCLFIDDSTENVQIAREMGFQTVQVTSKPKDSPAHHVILKITDLPDVFPDLWS